MTNDVWRDIIIAELDSAIEHQLDNYATGSQQREFLRDDDGSEPQARELMRLNLEQFVAIILPQYGFEVIRTTFNDGSCIRCGSAPRGKSGLCNTCLDEDAIRAGEIDYEDCGNVSATDTKLTKEDSRYFYNENGERQSWN